MTDFDDAVGPHLGLLGESHGLPLACCLVDTVLVVPQCVALLRLEGLNHQNKTCDKNKKTHQVCARGWGSGCGCRDAGGSVFDGGQTKY